MKQKKELLFNVLFLLAVMLIHIYGDYMRKGNLILFSAHYYYLSITFFCSSLLVYLINYKATLIILSQKKYALYVILFLGLILVFGFTRFILEEVIVYKITGKHNYQYDVIDSKLLKNLGFDALYYTIRICLVSSLVCLVFKNSKDKKLLYELDLEHQKAQLLALKSQISPHFLFNTLNNFYVELYDDKPEIAKDILKLSQLLRYVTYETSEDFVSLKKEVDFIKDYLHFFKRRYEDGFSVDLQIEGVITNQKIPSLILIHFVENICKHGIINNKEHPAFIKLKITEVALELTAENYNNTSDKHELSGVGTENIKKRLNVIYKENYILEHTKTETNFKTYLKIKL